MFQPLEGFKTGLYHVHPTESDLDHEIGLNRPAIVLAYDPQGSGAVHILIARTEAENPGHWEQRNNVPIADAPGCFSFS